MSNFIRSSIGKKFLVSISGLFLVTFLTVHLIANLGLLFGEDAYNIVVHFMDTNPLIQIMQPVLALGFILHIVYATMVELQNRGSRPVKYKKSAQPKEVTWVSRNMIYLGIIIFTFLVIHLFNFFYNMKFVHDHPLLKEVNVDGVMMHNAYALVAGLFTNGDGLFAGSNIVYSILYMMGGIALGLHIRHGFWSAFQTLGLSNNIWRKRLSVLGNAFAIIIGGGFTIIPLFFLLIK